MSIVISVEDVWKEYRLGVIGHGTLSQDLQSWWARLLGKEDPNALVMDEYGSSMKGDRVTGKVWALKDVNLKVERGEVIGVIGKNGAGKSTLLKILSRVTTPTRGQIKIRGRIASLLEVGTGFHPELTGMENIYMNGAILGMSRGEITAQKEQIIEFSGVEQYIDTPVKRYSSGMRVRLAFAVAAHLDPEILIIDEVLAVGDAEFQKKCLGKMSEEANSGRTILFVSHNMASVQSLCSRAVLIENGSVHRNGDTELIIDEYLKAVEDESVEVKLAEREDRKGTGLLRFEQIHFYRNESEKSTKNILSGDRIAIKMMYVSKRETSDITFAIAFYTSNGNFLFSCSSNEINKNMHVRAQPGEVVCEIPRLQLSKGLYYYNVIALKKNEILDVVNKAGFINVENGDFYNTGKNPAGERSGILIDYNYLT